MSHLKTKWILIGFLAFFAKYSFSHGIEYQTINGGVGIKVQYDNGTAMSYAETKVYSPEDNKIVFQQGLTDKNGIFMFNPDTKGEWKIIINDGTGHGINTHIHIDKLLKAKKSNNKYFLLWQKILISLSLIWGFMGLLFYLKAKRN